MCLWPIIDSASGHHKDLRSVSLEPVGQGGRHWVKFFFEKWPVAELPIKMLLFYGKFCFE